MEGIREESFNLMLAELLAEKGLRALGEVILKKGGRRAEPDVLIMLNGVRIVIEGKKLGAWDQLYKQCQDRLDTNTCDMCVMVEYTHIESGKVSPTQEDIKEALLRGKFNIGFQSYLDRANLDRWTEVQPKQQEYKGVEFDELLTYLMTAYTEVVSQDLVQPVVNKIDEVLKDFAKSVGTEVNLERLKNVMELRHKQEENVTD